MASSSNSHEKIPQGDCENPANVTEEGSTSRPTSPRTPSQSPQKLEDLEQSLNASRRNSFTPPMDHASRATRVEPGSTLTESRYIPNPAQNPFLSLMRKDFTPSTSESSNNSTSSSSSVQFFLGRISPFSSQPQSPAASPVISSPPSSDNQKSTLTENDIGLVPSPTSIDMKRTGTQPALPYIPLSETKDFLSAYKIDAKSIRKKDTLRTDPTKQVQHCVLDTRSIEEDLMVARQHQVSNESDTKGRSLDRYKASNVMQKRAVTRMEEAIGQILSSHTKGEVLTSTIGSVARVGTDDDVAMRTWPITTRYSEMKKSSMRPKAPDTLFKKRLLRGLRNNGNTCFINVILQSLMSCDPFRKLALSEEAEEGMLIEKFSHLAWEMTEEASMKSMHNDFSSDASLLPKWFFGIFNPAEAIADRHIGTQEDAEEFLSFMLNKLQDQEVARIKGRIPCSKSDECSSGWQVGAQGQRFVDTNISGIFGGSSISEVRRTSQKPSVTEASFFSLSLDVDLESVNSILDALNNYCATEVISDEIGKDGTEMKIEKQMFLMEIPKVLILHLKRFSYDGITLAPKKMTKEIKFPELLELPEAIIREKETGQETNRTYELIAAVTHLGPKLAGGHYYCDVRFRKTDGSSIWVKCDDEILKEVELEEVLRRDAYVLFYRAV